MSSRFEPKDLPPDAHSLYTAKGGRGGHAAWEVRVRLVRARQTCDECRRTFPEHPLCTDISINGIYRFYVACGGRLVEVVA